MAPLKQHIRKFARDMRSDPTKAEKKMWDALRTYKQDGIRFRRQVPFDNYIVDFACHDPKLIIEIDGYTHTSDHELKYDEGRQNFLESRGYKVMRFWNEDIYHNLNQVIAEIESYIMPPTPNPSPLGGGESQVVISSPPSHLRGGIEGGGT